jgi:threonine aldolase
MQLASKMRFISAQYIAYFNDDLWKRCATHSNDMAQLLRDKLRGIPQIKITQPVQSNGVFVIMPKDVAEAVREHYFFYPWDEHKSEWRLMCSWDTEEEDINNFTNLLIEKLRR